MKHTDDYGPSPPHGFSEYALPPIQDLHAFLYDMAYETRRIHPTLQIQHCALCGGMSVPFHQELGPPNHTRSMYANIPLPDVREEKNFADGRFIASYKPTLVAFDSFVSSSGSSSSDNVTMSSTTLSGADEVFIMPKSHCSTSRVVELHPVLQVKSPTSSRCEPTLKSCSIPPPTEVEADVYNQPATIPGVGYLTLVADYTGQTIGIHPSSSYIVTVGDVLHTLRALSFDEEPYPKRLKNWPPKPLGAYLSRLVSKLRLWWKAGVGGCEQERKSWRLVGGF